MGRVKVKRGDLIRLSWMEGEPVAEVLDVTEWGDPVVEHPRCPGLGPMAVDVYEWVVAADDPDLTIGAHI